MSESEAAPSLSSASVIYGHKRRYPSQAPYKSSSSFCSYSALPSYCSSSPYVCAIRTTEDPRVYACVMRPFVPSSNPNAPMLSGISEIYLSSNRSHGVLCRLIPPSRAITVLLYIRSVAHSASLLHSQEPHQTENQVQGRQGSQYFLTANRRVRGPSCWSCRDPPRRMPTFSIGSHQQ